MRRLIPNHRFLSALAAVEAGETPADPRIAALVACMNGRPCADTAVAEAFDLFKRAEHREVLDAFCLARVSYEVICSSLEIPQSVVQAYEYLFMDCGVFRNKLERMTYAAEYEGSEYGKELVRTAVAVGSEYLLWAFGDRVSDVEPKAIIRRTMVDAYYRGLAHKGNSLTSAVAKEAQKWWSTAVKNAQLIENIDPQTSKTALEELRLAIEGKDTTLSPEEAPVSIDEILH